MANVKISQLPVTTTLTGNSVFPVVSGANTFQVSANTIANFVGGGGNASTGNVTFDNNIVIGTGNGFGSDGLYLAVGPSTVANAQLLRVRGGDNPTHIHLDTGDNDFYDQYFGDDGKYLKLEAGISGNIVIGTDGNGQNWTFDDGGSVTLPTVSNESTKLVGTRTIVGGQSATNPYSTVLAAGGTPTVAYVSTLGVQSTRVTFAVQSGGGGYQWEQFDVVATSSQDDPGTVNFVVSNRVKSAAGIADTVVTATMNGSQIEISLTLDAGQTSGGAASFNAVEFGLMID